MVLDVVPELAREGLLSDLLYIDGLALLSETMVGLRNRLMKWKEGFGSKGLKVNLGNSR